MKANQRRCASWEDDAVIGRSQMSPDLNGEMIKFCAAFDQFAKVKLSTTRQVTIANWSFA